MLSIVSTSKGTLDAKRIASISFSWSVTLISGNLTILFFFNLQKLSDLPTVDELGAAGLIDTSSVEKSIFGTGKFYKENQDEKKEDIYSNIDEMLQDTLSSEENSEKDPLKK